jgi:signal transduction histidine kinase
VDISARRTGDGEIEISVRDYGPGLSPELASKIFGRFFSTKSEGMGMGLSIARSIVEAHGGLLGVGHPEGGGARFWFTIPACAEIQPKEIQEKEKVAV